jgi:hypothetical protein
MHGAAALVYRAVSLGVAKSVSLKKFCVKFENNFKSVRNKKNICCERETLLND